jgi:hypothetical protein
MTMEEFAQDCRAELPKAEAALAAQIERDRAQIADCVATKSSMPEHYWHPRYRLEEQVRALRKLIEALSLPA